MTRPSPCYIFDIDGTLADCSHRLHHIQKQPKDWKAFHSDVINDAPIPHMVALAKSLPHPIICISGRSDVSLLETQNWLIERAGILPAALYLRKASDHRDDDILKIDLLAQARADGWRPIGAVTMLAQPGFTFFDHLLRAASPFYASLMDACERRVRAQRFAKQFIIPEFQSFFVGRIHEDSEHFRRHAGRRFEGHQKSPSAT